MEEKDGQRVRGEKRKDRNRHVKGKTRTELTSRTSKEKGKRGEAEGVQRTRGKGGKVVHGSRVGRTESEISVKGKREGDK